MYRGRFRQIAHHSAARHAIRIVVDFRRPLVGERSPGAEDARGAGRGRAGQEMAASLYDLHRSLLAQFRDRRERRPVAHAFSSRLSSFEKTPVGALGDERFGLD